jgi:hypothetical protein
MPDGRRDGALATTLEMLPRRLTPTMAEELLDRGYGFARRLLVRHVPRMVEQNEPAAGNIAPEALGVRRRDGLVAPAP